MKQPLAIVGIIVAALLVFGTTFAVVKILTMTNEIASLNSQIAAVESGGSSTSSGSSLVGDLKVAVVRVDFVAQEYQKIPEVEEYLTNQLSGYTTRLQELQDSLQAGAISEDEYNAQAQQLIAQTNEATVNLIARPIQQAVFQIGQEQGYHLIVKVEDVVLFSQGNIMEDITEQVLDRMIRNR